jgi:hypothetical protein
MNRPRSLETSEPPAIHPVLAAALNCVDVQLEIELARYRRDRAPADEENASPPPLTMTVAPTSSPPPEPVSHPQADNPLNLKFSEGGSLVHTPPAEQPANPPQPELPPDDYLESSEQLLRNLSHNRPSPEKETAPTVPERLLTPLGIGAIVLLFGAIALAGAALLDLEALTNGRWQLNRSPDAATEPIAATEPSPTSAANTTEDLDLDNLSTIQPSPRDRLTPPPTAPNAPLPPPSAVPPNYSIPGSSSDLTSALVPPLDPTTAASPQPSPAAPAPTQIEPAPGPTSSDFYYVLADYSGPNSLQQAQAIVTDAYVRQFAVGDRIQMGAFLTKADADDLARRLQREGLAVSVYRP